MSSFQLNRGTGTATCSDSALAWKPKKFTIFAKYRHAVHSRWPAAAGFTAEVLGIDVIFATLGWLGATQGAAVYPAILRLFE